MDFCGLRFNSETRSGLQCRKKKLFGYEEVRVLDGGDAECTIGKIFKKKCDPDVSGTTELDGQQNRYQVYSV